MPLPCCGSTAARVPWRAKNSHSCRSRCSTSPWAAALPQRAPQGGLETGTDDLLQALASCPLGQSAQRDEKWKRENWKSADKQAGAPRLRESKNGNAETSPTGRKCDSSGWALPASSESATIPVLLGNRVFRIRLLASFSARPPLPLATVLCSLSNTSLFAHPDGRFACLLALARLCC